MSRRWLAPEVASDLGRLDPDAVARVRSEAWPDASNADELHDALAWLGYLTQAEAAAEPNWSDWLQELSRQNRVAELQIAPPAVWITAKRLPEFASLCPDV